MNERIVNNGLDRMVKNITLDPHLLVMQNICEKARILAFENKFSVNIRKT